MSTQKPTEAPKVSAQVEVKSRDGENLLVSGTLAPQVNAATGQRITKGKPTLVVHDWWIGMMLKSGVLTEHKI